MATKQDTEVFSGNDVVLAVALTARDGSELDLTGAQAITYAIGRSATSGSIVTKTLGAGVTVIDAGAGSIEVDLAAADLEPLAGVFYHELRLTDSNGKKSTLMYGALTIAANLVRN